MSFLDRFQSKIATVTAHGHLKKADGSEEIRVGPPKRKPRAPTPESNNARANPLAGKQQQQQQSATNGNSHCAGAGAGVTTNTHAGKSGVQKQGGAAVPPLMMAPGNASKAQQTHLATTNGNKQQHQQQAHGSPNASPRHKSGRDASGFDNNHSHRDAYKHHFDADNIPGRLKDDYYDEPQYSSRSYGQSKSPSPTHDRYSRHDDPRSRFVAPPEPEQRNRSPRSVAARDASPQKDMRSPQEINEARVQSDQDQLAFSRKARPVQYEPCKLSQYKKEKPLEYYELGKLQPDLNSEDLVQKRANAERIKAFSKNLRAINKATQPKKSDSNNDSPSAPSGATKPGASTRSKALEFAKRIPKPKHSSRSDDSSASLTSAASSSNIQSIAATSRPINCVLDDDSEDDQVSSELQQLQLRHQASRAQVEALIKKG